MDYIYFGLELPCYHSEKLSSMVRMEFQKKYFNCCPIFCNNKGGSFLYKEQYFVLILYPWIRFQAFPPY